MLRVLQINAGSKIYGGVSAFCLNIYRKIDRDKVQFDFLTPNITTYGSYKEEIETFGGHVYELGINAKTFSGKIKLFRGLRDFLSTHNYDVIHINSGVLLFNCFVAYACRKYSNARIFVHSHSNGGRSSIKELLSSPLKAFLAGQADRLLACSVSAAKYMFPKNKVPQTAVIKNGIDSEKFHYNPVLRDKIRDELGLTDKFVIGHVGRFTYEKNQEFLLDLLCEVKKNKKNNAVLMLIGEGPRLEEIQDMAKQKQVNDSVMFLGARNDVGNLYQAMDVFVLPSIFEGFGIVNIEAQATGLKCVTSTAVPKEVDITGNVSRIALDNSLDAWAAETVDVPESRKDCTELVVEHGYDIGNSAIQLEKMYDA